MVKWDEHRADIKLGSHVCFTFEVFSPLILKCQQGDSMLHDSNFKAIINQLKLYFLECMQFEVCKTTFDLAFIETIHLTIMRILALVYFYTTTQLFHSISTHSLHRKYITRLCDNTVASLFWFRERMSMPFSSVYSGGGRTYKREIVRNSVYEKPMNVQKLSCTTTNSPPFVFAVLSVVAKFLMFFSLSPLI